MSIFKSVYSSSITYCKSLMVIASIIILNSCSSTKLTCTKFYTYESKKLNIKGITAKLKKQGIDVGEISVGEISIEPQYVVASQKLQELDLLQYSLCGQIKGLPKKDSLRMKSIESYINTLQGMIQIAQRPDSLIASEVDKLKKAEEKRSKNEREDQKIKTTSPKVDAELILNNDSSLYLRLTFLNEVPIKFNVDLLKYNTPIGLGAAFFESPAIYPKENRKQFTTNLQANLGDQDFIQNEVRKITLRFLYKSIFFEEQGRDPRLMYRIIKSYDIDYSLCSLNRFEFKVEHFKNE